MDNKWIILLKRAEGGLMVLCFDGTQDKAEETAEMRFRATWSEWDEYEVLALAAWFAANKV